MSKLAHPFLASSLAGLLVVLPSFSLAPVPTFSALSNLGQAQAADKIPIAVLDFQAKGDVSDDEASIISDRIRTQMFRSGRYHIMERADMLSILKEQGFQQSQVNCDGTNCSVELGKLLAVRQIMTGSVSKLGSIYTLTLRIVDVEKGEIIRDEYRDCRCSLEEVLTRLTVEMVAELTGEQTQPKPVATPVTPKPVLTPVPKASAKPLPEVSPQSLASQPLALRQAYYQRHSHSPAAAFALNLIPLPVPIGYAYLGDWDAFWSVTWWQLGLAGGVVLLAAAAPNNSAAASTAGLISLISGGIWIYTWFDGWGKADAQNEELRHALQLAQESWQQQGLSYGSSVPENIPMVPVYQQQFRF